MAKRVNQRKNNARSEAKPGIKPDLHPSAIKGFTTALMHWHREENNRQMPWKGESDPYKIWLSEIILQQTRVEQGMPYYLRFIEKYPSIKELAAAPDDEVYKLWEGLGYYSRCSNLLHTARFLAKNNNGAFPSNLDDLLALKGIGNYTAAAIASFAFGLATAVVDGNVIRVLARFFGIAIPFDIPEGKKYYSALAQQSLDQKEPAQYNQAIMDFGAVVCTPKNPSCSACPLQSACFAFQKNMVALLPVRSKKVAVKNRYFRYYMLLNGNKVLMRKRQTGDIWKNLYEFVLVEKQEPFADKHDEITHEAKKYFDAGFSLISVSQPKVHQLTHQRIHAQFVKAKLCKKIDLATYQWVNLQSLQGHAFPIMIKRFIEESIVPSMD